MTAKSPWDPPDHQQGPPSGGGFRWALWLTVIGGGALLIYFLSSVFGGSSGRDSSDTPRLIYLLVLLVAVSSSLFLRRRIALGKTLRYLGIWGLLFLVAVAGGVFWSDLTPMKDRVLGALAPAKPSITGEGVVINRRLDGHFWVEAEVEGVSILFIIDTGATNVVLSPDDARKIGMRVDDLNFSQATSTANGIGAAAPVRLRDIAIGTIVVSDVSASVNGADMNASLLGMSFLNQLSGFSVDGERLTLKN